MASKALLKTSRTSTFQPSLPQQKDSLSTIEMMLSILSVVVITLTNADWGYDEPDNNASHWAELFAECGYSRQSPIDIPLDINHECDEPLELQWISEPSHYAIRNTGYSLQAMPFVIDHAGGSDISGLEVLHHTNDTNIRIQNSFYHTYESMINKGTVYFNIRLWCPTFSK